MNPSGSHIFIKICIWLFKALISLMLLASIGYMGWYNYGKIHSLLFPPIPCAQPITYSIGTNDLRFKLSKEELQSIIAAAGDVWSTEVHKPLFTYDPSGKGKLKINLMYDYRQHTTDELHTLDSKISTDTSAYTAVKMQYDSLIASFNNDKVTIASMEKSLSTAQTAYQQKVSYWNTRGGAPREEYTQLENERSRINSLVTALNSKATQLNAQIPHIKEVETQLNTLAQKVNLTKSTQEDIGSILQDEFREGQYTSDDEGERIDIYQYDTENILHRVMIHELGHALGLEHNDNPEAIMYKSNSEKSLKLAKEDIDSLLTLCKLKQ